MKRHHFIDQIRAFAIFLIIFGHNHYSSPFSEFLTSFRLPLFFIISGLVGRDKSQSSFFDVVKKGFFRLLIPYFGISTMLYAFWFLLGRHYGHSVEEAYDPLMNFIGIFYAQGGPAFMNWGIPMWFLPALFVLLLIDFFVAKLPFVYRIFSAVIIPVLGLFIFKLLGFHLPWSIDVAMVVYGFYFLGTLLKRINLIDWITGKEFLLIVVFFIVHMVGVQFNTKVLFYYGEYGVFPIMYFNGIVGFVWVFALFKLLPTTKYLTWIGKNTLPLLAFHLTAITAIKGVAIFGFGTEIHFTLYSSLLLSALQIAILVPAILFLNRYLPFLVGIPKKISLNSSLGKANG